MKSSRTLLIVIALFIFLIGFSQWKINATYQWPYPEVNKLVVTEHYTTDLAALLLGSHRVASDIAYVHFLQYYGTRLRGTHSHRNKHFPEKSLNEGQIKMDDDHEEQDGNHHDHDNGHNELDSKVNELKKSNINYEGGYFRLKEFIMRILYLDPYFHRAVLEGAGALAFNQKRIEESLDVLRAAMRHDPTFHRYRLYTAAILYRNEGQDLKLIDSLVEAIQYPDCPPLLENVLANLLIKYERYADAAQVYVHTINTAAELAYRVNAEKALDRLINKHPEILKQK